MLKRTPLRKKTRNPIKRLKDRADRAFQDYLRYKHKGERCESCGVNPIEVGHHYILKSHSNILRYDESNIFLICNFCHSKITFYNAAEVEDKIVLKRGKKWYNWIHKAKREHLSLTKKYLESKLEEFEI